MNANDVIRIGRSRSRAASTAASNRLTPSCCRSRANWTMRMAFLAARPTSTTKPTCTKMFTSMPYRARPHQRAEQAHRHDEDHRPRQRPALVQARQHEEDQHHPHREGAEGVVPQVAELLELARLLLQVAHLGPLGGHVARQVLAQPLHGRQGVAHAGPGQRQAVDRGRREHVVAGDLDRPGAVAHLGHRPQRHHVAVGVAHLELLDGFRVGAEGRVGLDVDLPGAAEAVEVVDVVAAQVRLQRVEDVGQRHPHRLGLLAVDVHVELRRAGAEAVEQADQARLLVALGGQLVRAGLQRVEVHVADALHHQLEAGGGPQARDRRRPEDQHAGLGDLARQALADLRRDGVPAELEWSRRSWNGLKMMNTLL